jgi:hypothetical protein
MFAKELGLTDFRKTRDEADVEQTIPFSNEEKKQGGGHSEGGAIVTL